MSARHDDETWFRTFVSTARWRFAKTYVENYPHEYTLDEDGWCEEADFQSAIACIERWGVTGSFWSARRKYFYLDDRKFWHMGDADAEDEGERPQLINRSWVDVARYAGDAKRLGYDDAALEEMIRRWHELLHKARG